MGLDARKPDFVAWEQQTSLRICSVWSVSLIIIIVYWNFKILASHRTKPDNKYFGDNAQTTFISSEHVQNICKVPKRWNQIDGENDEVHKLEKVKKKIWR